MMFSLNKIESLKKKAGKAYCNYYSVFDKYSCGHELLKHISSDAVRYATEFNETWVQLEQLDPSCPKGKRL